jgi:hypothetical protein
MFMDLKIKIRRFGVPQFIENFILLSAKPSMFQSQRLQGERRCSSPSLPV